MLQRVKLLQSFRSHLHGTKIEVIAHGQRAECVSFQCTEECFLAFVNFASAFYKTELTANHDVFDVSLILQPYHNKATYFTSCS